MVSGREPAYGEAALMIPAGVLIVTSGFVHDGALPPVSADGAGPEEHDDGEFVPP